MAVIDICGIAVSLYDIYSAGKTLIHPCLGIKQGCSRGSCHHQSPLHNTAQLYTCWQCARFQSKKVVKILLWDQNMVVLFASLQYGISWYMNPCSAFVPLHFNRNKSQIQEKTVSLDLHDFFFRLLDCLFIYFKPLNYYVEERLLIK